MASITSLSKSSGTSSLYGNRNVISGLASGMDTEAMIENSIAGYRSKINALQQRMTKLQWKQDAYRGLISQMNSVLSKYTSYSSSTNLFSPSFFTKAVNTTANGTNAAKVIATGRSSSDVVINSIKRLAEAATYTTGTDHLTAKGAKMEDIDWDANMETSAVSGSITIKYGGGDTGKGNNFTLYFEESEVFHSSQELADAINKQLEEKKITNSGGETNKASQYIKAQVGEDGRIQLVDQKNNSFKITDVSGDMENIFKESEAQGKIIASEYIGTTEEDFKKAFVKEVDRAEYLSDKSLSFTLDNKTKSIQLKDIFESEEFKNASTKEEKTAALAKGLQAKLDAEFGKGKIGVIAEGGALKFGGPVKTNDDGTTTLGELPKGSVLKVGGTDTVNKGLGISEGGYSNTLQTNWTLEKVLGADNFTEKQKVQDKDGQWVEKEDSEAKYATITINGTDIQVSKDDTIQTMMEKINGSDAGVNVKYSAMTGNFRFTTKETGEDEQISISGLGKDLFGDTEKAKAEYEEAVKNGTDTSDLAYTGGKNAELEVTVNGEKMTLNRASNTVDLDGLSVTLKGTFEADPSDPDSAISFTTTSDSDKIVDAVKAFVEDYNKMVTDIRSAYTTETLKNSSKDEYQPLTDDDMANMSESAIKAYEEKAKTGLLFGDTDLSNLYSKLTNAIQGEDGGAMLRSIGIKVSYADGLSTISLDEEALRNALDTDPDKVKNAFTQTQANGASSNGLMYNIKNTLEQYGSTSIANPGILVNKAGTTLSSYSLSHNELNDQMDGLQEQIEKWQDRMSDRVDYYTNQFTKLEMLISQMNSQSSMLAGLSGGM